MDPTPVYATIDRLRHAPEDRDPARRRRRPAADADAGAGGGAPAVAPRPARGMVRRAGRGRPAGVDRPRAGQGHPRAREPRGPPVLHELARRAAERGGPADVRLGFCVTIDELADFVESPADFEAVIAERAAQAAVPQRPGPAAVVRRPHPRSGHLADAGPRPGAPAPGRRDGRSRASR